MCKLKFTKERVGCYLLVILVICLLIGVLFGLGVFRHKAGTATTGSRTSAATTPASTATQQPN
jgi:Tfp pilus assembly protein PilX